MKISKSILSKVLLAAGFILASQSLFATDIIIRKDDSVPPPGPMPLIEEVFPVTATVDSGTLAVHFDTEVGNATIRVLDSNNQVVYQEVLNTATSSECNISVANWNSGGYTLKIAYGTTRLTGDFVL